MKRESCPLTAAQLEQTQALFKPIQTAIIESGGGLPFRQFMQLALYHPEWGYYSSSLVKLGSKGDFVTAPELSPWFAKCLARQCAAIFQSLLKEGVSPEALTLVELGGGTGRMAADLLIALKALNQLPARYIMVEVSPSLKAAQKRYLATHCPFAMERITWCEKLPASPVIGVMIANEVLDAFPVERLMLAQGQLRQGHVVLTAEGELAWQFLPAASSLEAQVSAYLPLKDPAWCGERQHYFFEFLPQLAEWVSTLQHSLEKGVALFIDYGYPAREYYHPERQQGTLACYYQHICHDDPLWLPGLQDITSHVDFTRLARCAHEAGFKVAGYSHQGAFLLNCGLPAMVASAVDHREQRALQTLLLPGEMGEACKVMALTYGLEVDELLGFMAFDRRHQL